MKRRCRRCLRWPQRSPFYSHICDIKWTYPASTLLNCLYLEKVLKIKTQYFDQILTQVLKLYYQNLGFISLTVKILCTLWDRKNFGNFRQFFFIITFPWKGNFKFWSFHWKHLTQIYLSQTYFKCKNYFSSMKIKFKMKKFDFFDFFFRITSKLQRFCKFLLLHRKERIFGPMKMNFARSLWKHW